MHDCFCWSVILQPAMHLDCCQQALAAHDVICSQQHWWCIGVRLLASQACPPGYVPLTLNNGAMTCQMEGGGINTLTLATHTPLLVRHE